EPAPDYLSTLMVEPNTVLVSTAVAERYGLAPGDTLTARLGTQRHPLTLVGLLEPSDDLSRRALDALLISDIATAQEVLGRVGRLDRIDLLIPDGETGDAALARIAAILPPDVRLASS